MASILRDHKVTFRRRDYLARVALEWWSLADKQGRYDFNICRFIYNVLIPKLRGKGRLQIKFYDPVDLPEQACVTFDPLTLHVVKKIWEDADRGEAYARFMIAHEIGHIILHDSRAAAFSGDEAAIVRFAQREESAESQANDFADLFLVPDHVALKLNNRDKIAVLCVVPDETAERRLHDAHATREPLCPSYEGDMCMNCHSFTVVQAGNLRKCDTCGWELGF